MRRALAVNAALGVAAWVAAAPGLPGPARMLAAASLVLVLPGMGWLGAFGVTLTPARLALIVVGTSSLSAIVGCAATVLLATPTRSWPFLLWTTVAVNAGLALGRRPVRLEPGAPWRAIGGVFAAGFVGASLAALLLVPPLEDHDMEVRGTAYGLLTEGKPYFTTNREVFLPMSHPILFNVLVAESLLVAGEIENTRPSYESAKRAEAAARTGSRFDTNAAWQSDYEAFRNAPALVGTRAPSALLAGAVLALLFDLGWRVTGRWIGGLAAATLYATVPETIVRSAYAGYFGETVFAMLVAVMLFGEDDLPHPGSWLAAAGALMAVFDHTSAVLVLGIAAWQGVRALAARTRPDMRAVGLVSGFSGGTLVWWMYGFWVEPAVFVADHLRKHLAHRILLNDLRLVGDRLNHYAPSIPELWVEFAAHTGYVLLPLAIGAAVAALVSRRDDRLTLLAIWFASGAIAFSLVDWRQTKHLMNGLAPMAVLAVAAVLPSSSPRDPARRSRWRAAVFALLLAGTAVNVVHDARLLADFSSLRISGASDVDGW